MDAAPLIDRLKAAYPEARTALTHENPLQLLVATILSAQCTDARVNLVTPQLFAKYPDAPALAGAPQEDVEEVIRSTGFYRNKAKSIRGAAQRIVEAFGGRVPDTMEELLTLPGVARKTANVVLGSAYGVASGVVVDTHVERLAHRMGLSKSKTAEKVEQDLMRILPRGDWICFSHVLIHHGRRICQARAPKCGECQIQDLCPSAPLFLGGLAPTTRRARTAAGRPRVAVAVAKGRGAAGKRAAAPKGASPAKRAAAGKAASPAKRAAAGKAGSAARRSGAPAKRPAARGARGTRAR